MKVLKKGISLFLVLALMAMMVTACGSKDDASTSETETSSDNEATADGSTDGGDAEEMVTLTWVLIGDQHPDDDMVLEEFNKRLAEKLPNTKLEILSYGFGDFADRIELMITAGEDFDIMWCSNWSGDYLQKVANGAFMPLDDLIDSDGAQLKEVLPEMVFQTGLYDGKQYGLTNYQQLWAGYGVVVQDEYAEAYGLDIAGLEIDGADRSIETIEIFEGMEPYFANALAADLGLKSIIDPWFLVNKTVTENLFMERDYESIVAPASIDKFDNDNVTLVNMFATPEYKQFIDWMREQYQAGYIRKDVLSAELPTGYDDERILSYALMTTNTGTPDDFDLELVNKMTPAVTSARIAPLYLPYTAGTATMNFINAKSKNPERAMQLLELMNTDAEMYNLLANGIEGVHWDFKENPEFTETPIEVYDAAAYTRFDWTLGSVANSYLRSANFLEARLEIWNNKAPLSPVFGFVPELSDLTQDKAKIDAVVTEFAMALNSGADSDYEEHYVEFLEKLEAAGVDEFIAALQEQVDAYLGQ